MNKKYYNSKGLQCGELYEGIYRKHIKGSKHILRVMNAIGVDKVIIDDLETLKTQFIRIKDDENGMIYAVEFKTFKDMGVERDLGSGLQVFLPLQYWVKE